MLKQKFIKCAAVISVFFLISTPVLAQVDIAFTPDKLIDDKVFADIQTFGGPEGIQKFLESKNSILANVSTDFLARFKEPQDTSLKVALEDPEPNLGRLRTAAELIWDASKQSGLNPQVILVTLNKEQGLITTHQNDSEAVVQKALDHALGFDCPDATGCGNLFPGFYYQLFGNVDSGNNRYLGAAKSLMKSFSVPSGRGPLFNGSVSHVGDVITLDNTQGPPNNAMPQQSITLSNRATAALYRFTPHVFNGNYNFWKFFNAWFKYPNGTLLKLANGVDTYIIQNGVKQLIPTFVAQARNLDLSKTIVISPTEFDSYQTDKVLGPTDNTLVMVIGENKKYVFLDNTKHPVSDLVITQRGLDPSKVLSISAQDSALFQSGNVLPPKDGTIIRGTEDKTVFLVTGGKIKSFSAYTFNQHKVTVKQVTSVPDAEISMYEKNGFVPPIDGSLIKTADTGTVFLVENGLRRQVLGDIFKNRGFSFKNVATLAGDELSSIPVGSYATPKDRTFFVVESKTGPFYMFREGTKHSISAFVAKQRHLTPDYTFTNDVAVEWYEGIPVPPTDNTIIKGDSSGTVFLVVKGQLRPLTAAAFKRRGITVRKIVTLPQLEVDAYAKGDVLDK